jgi:secondary thiamine-phosphate synthase enzyme
MQGLAINNFSDGVDFMIATRYLEFETCSGDTRNITEDVQGAVAGSGITAGLATIFVPGATAAIITIEYEDGLAKDLWNALERLIPQEMEYLHNLRWQDGNGHSHIRASILGPSLTVPFDTHGLMLGTWQQIVFLELDNRSRKRKVIVQIIGE